MQGQAGALRVARPVPGRPHEASGNRRPREMVAHDRIRLTGLLRNEPRRRGSFYSTAAPPVIDALRRVLYEACPVIPERAIMPQGDMSTPGNEWTLEGNDRRVISRMAQPRQCTVRLSDRRTRSGPARLRTGCARPPACSRAMAAARCDRDHALPPRPLRRPRSMGMGESLRTRCAVAEAPPLRSAGGDGCAQRHRCLPRRTGAVLAGV